MCHQYVQGVPTGPLQIPSHAACALKAHGALKLASPINQTAFHALRAGFVDLKASREWRSLRHAQMVMSAGALRRRLLNLIIHARLAIGATRAQVRLSNTMDFALLEDIVDGEQKDTWLPISSAPRVSTVQRERHLSSQMSSDVHT